MIFCCQAWLAEIHEYAQDDVVIMLLGNKSDMSAERVVRREDGERLAKVSKAMERNIQFVSKRTLQVFKSMA